MEGFSEDPNELIIIKKIVGNFTKQLSQVRDIKRLEVSHEHEADKHVISVKLVSDKTIEASKNGGNLFFALSDALKQLEKEATKD